MFVVIKRDSENNIIDLWKITDDAEPSKYDLKKAEEFTDHFCKMDPDHRYELRYIGKIPDLTNKSE